MQSRSIRGVLPLTLTIVIALVAGCDDKSASAPAVTAAPGSAGIVPSGGDAGGPALNETCDAVIDAVTGGSVEIANDAVTSIDEHWSTEKVNDHLRASFRTMAKKVGAAAAEAGDPELRATVQKVADRLAEGGRSNSPDRFLQKDFQSLSPELDKLCNA